MRVDLGARGEGSSGETRGQARVAELDGLRGLAILLVVVCHSSALRADAGGIVGVCLFFVLSGYLITTLLVIERDTHGTISLKSFYSRRALRLFPALAVYLAMVALLLAASGIGIGIWHATWPPVFYLANYAQIFGHNVFPHSQTWSLAVEEHFYLVWPVLVGLGATRRIRMLAIAVGLLVGWRLVVGNIDGLWAYFGTDTNAYALGAGALLGTARHQGFAPRVPRAMPVIGACLLITASFIPVDGNIAHLKLAVWLGPLVALIAGLTILGALDHPTPFLRARVLTWLGLISYALYLWHAPLMFLPPWTRSVEGRLTGLAMAVGLAAVSWHFVERPIQRSPMRRRLQRSTLVEPPALSQIVVDLTSIEDNDEPPKSAPSISAPSLPVA